MKKWTILLIVLLTAVMALLPLLGSAMSGHSQTASDHSKDSGSKQTVTTKKQENNSSGSSGSSKDTFLIYDEGTKKQLKVSHLEYMQMATACEMPALYEPEALKAQAVACLTYALYLDGMNTDKTLPILSVNTKEYKGFCTTEGLKKLWGKQYSNYYKRICDAVNAVKDKMVVYDGKPILAAYYAVSTGYSESSETVWGRAVPYLVPVEISQDRLAKNYEQTTRYSTAQVKQILQRFHAKITLSDQPENWFATPIYNASETVTAAQVGDITMTGQQLRSLFQLPSASFVVTREGDEFVFTTHGYGHCVGLSQNGANAMAQSGADWEQILCYFYTGCKIASV